MTYNGYPNWETWNIQNWYPTLVEDHVEWCTSAEQVAEELEDFITEELFADIDRNESSYRADILNQALSAIDFTELAEDAWFAAHDND